MKVEKGTHLKSSRNIDSLGSTSSALLFLLIISLIASAAGIPYSHALLAQGSSAPSISSLLRIESISFILITLPLAFLGLTLGSQIGLGAPKLMAMLAKSPGSYRSFQSLIIPSTGLGVIGGALSLLIGLVFTPFLPPELMQSQIPSFFPALFGSFGAAIKEEVWLRLGIMTCLAWLGTKFMRQSKPGKISIWSANLLAAVVFALLHMPQASILAEGMTQLLLIYVLLTNGVLGLIFGWLYWQRGLLAAMIAHFSTNIVIHVIPALFGTSVG